MNPKDLKYTKSHEWAKVEGGAATVGVTHFAQEQLGDITFVDLPPVGSKVEAGMEMGSIESVKAASDLYSPVSGEVVAVNAALADHPELVNQSPYGDGWLIKVTLTDKLEGLLDADAYAEIAVPH